MRGIRIRRFASSSVPRVALILILAASAVGVQASTPRQARALTIAPVDGGPHYYGQFSNPLPDDPDFFPIMAWLRKAEQQSDIDAYVDFGLNGLVGVENPEGTQETLLRQAGLHVIIQADERTRFNDLGSETAGWLLYDEVDMCCGPPGFVGGNGYQMLDAIRAGLPRDNRLRYNNYGKGVMFWESDSEAARFVNDYQDVVANDIYWFTDPNERNRPGYRVAASYGTTVDRMRHLDSLDGKRQPVWNVVELGWPFTESASQGGRRILPAESRAAVWHSVIAGARGIVYFDHNFGPGTPGSTLAGEGYADTRAEMKAVNAQITALAPVLNSPTVVSGWSQGAGTTAMVKWAAAKKAKAKRCKSKRGKKKKCTAKGKKAKAKKRCRSKKGKKMKCAKEKGNLYVFAGSTGSPVQGRFSLPCVGNDKAAVLGENRAVRVRGGSFSDHFADGNAIHIYRIDGQSACVIARQGTDTPVGLPGGGTGGGEPLTSRHTAFSIITATIAVLLASLGIGRVLRRVGPRPGKRAKRSHRVGTR